MKNCSRRPGGHGWLRLGVPTTAWQLTHAPIGVLRTGTDFHAPGDRSTELGAAAHRDARTANATAAVVLHAPRLVIFPKTARGYLSHETDLVCAGARLSE